MPFNPRTCAAYANNAKVPPPSRDDYAKGVVNFGRTLQLRSICFGASEVYGYSNLEVTLYAVLHYGVV